MAVVQQSSAPTQKVVSATVAGAIVAIGVWALKEWGSTEVPGDIAAAMTVIVSAIVSYLVPPAERDQIKAGG